MEFKLEAVEVKPERSYRKGSKYDPILDAFMDSDHNMVTLGIEGKEANYMRTQLNKRIVSGNLPVSVSVVNNQVYLEKI